MHELSIAMSIVELAEEEAEQRGVQIEAVHLKLGALVGIVKEALLSCYEMACENTPLAGSHF
jgi:hydrogenase nickel incorporation protein HypA/HybF